MAGDTSRRGSNASSDASSDLYGDGPGSVAAKESRTGRAGGYAGQNGYTGNAGFGAGIAGQAQPAQQLGMFSGFSAAVAAHQAAVAEAARQQQQQQQEAQAAAAHVTGDLAASQAQAVSKQSLTDEQAGVGDDNDDASDAMSMSDASSSSESEEPSAQEPSHAGAKRKLSDVEAEPQSVPVANGEVAKKRRITPPSLSAVDGAPDVAGWPAELWQHAFNNLSPAMLCRCMRVCKAFRTYLTKAPRAETKKTTKRPLDSESVWIQARKHTYPAMPKPLAGFTEIQMYQLMVGTTCETCKRNFPTRAVRPTSVYDAGPGDNGVRVIWPFRLRLCGDCFVHHARKDVDLLSQGSLAALTNGLPHAFRSPDAHFISESTRQTHGINNTAHVVKVYHENDIAAILQEMEDVESYGPGVFDEWKKGLPQRKKDAMADSSRWERYEAQMPPGTKFADMLREYDPSFSLPYVAQQHHQYSSANGTHPAAHLNGNGALPLMPLFAYPPAPGTVPQASASVLQPLQPPPPSQPVQRTVRNLQEVEAARQTRRAEIERRCMELSPPLVPSVLQHTKAFRDTMQIITPLTDGQWENMLKPRILEEREAAELLEHQRQQQMAALQAALPSTSIDEPFVRPAKEVYDRDYQVAQEPLRTKLGEYADDRINGHWRHGQGLDKDNCVVFAVDVLMHVRRRYLADKEAGILPAPVEHSARSVGSKHSSPPLEPFLSLDNMKWVFDNKVRGLTDRLKKDLFICDGCAQERKPKWFAFEGLIQHYGARHTAEFSKGNVVVHWQTAEWPEEPPFHINPIQFLKGERKFQGAKNNGRARHTPQHSQDGPFVAPSQGLLLSEIPMFSGNGAVSSDQGSRNGSMHYQDDQSHNGPHRSQQARPYVDMSQEAQVGLVSECASDVWSKLEGVKMLDPVKMQTVIAHVHTRFTESFGIPPTLDLLTDALATNNLMRPIKNATALACKPCVAGQQDGSASYQSYYQRIKNVKLFNASSLITHFKLNHWHNGQLAWQREMMEVPELELVSDLIREPGMDDEKLALVAFAFPAAFPSPLPVIGTVPEALPDPVVDSGLANRLIKKFQNKGQNQPSKKKRKGLQHGNGRESSGEPFSGHGQEEYDPNQPFFAAKPGSQLDPSRFDTDLTRRRSSTPAATPASGMHYGLSDDTLKALSTLQAAQGSAPPPTQPADFGRASRSPSVGRTASRVANGAAPTANGNGIPAQMPDISAILAALQGGTPAAVAVPTPPTGPTYRQPSQTPRQPYTPYAQPAQQSTPAFARAETNRPGSRYFSDGSYRGSVEPAPAPRFDPHDLQAALARNNQSFAANAYPAYTEAAPAYNPPPAGRSPPRFTYVYDDNPSYAAPPAQQPYRYEGQRAPSQYASQPAPYQYATPQQPETIYVDEYGRPVQLIPVEAAPPPPQMQYQQYYYPPQQQPQGYDGYYQQPPQQ